MKVKSEDILKLGAVLKTMKIDFNDPWVKAIVAESKKQQKMLLNIRRYNQKKHDNLRKVITI